MKDTTFRLIVIALGLLFCYGIHELSNYLGELQNTQIHKEVDPLTCNQLNYWINNNSRYDSLDIMNYAQNKYIKDCLK